MSETGTSPALVGTTIAGKYRIKKRIGSGAMGTIYRAQHLTLDMPVAIKFLHKELNQDEGLVKRFEREAKTLCKLSQPNIVRVMDFGETPEGLMYFVMEYVEGESLFDYYQDNFPMSDILIVDIFIQITLALEEAHASGVIHRDLKPENIMLLPRNGHMQVKVLDFGIAKNVSEVKRGERETRLTSMGKVCGTPEYLSPEQAQGHELDGRSDLYSLGVVLYQILSGTLPFDGENPIEIALKQLTQAPVPPSERTDVRVNPVLEILALDLMAKKSEDRPESASDLLQQLSSIKQMLEPVQGTPTTTFVGLRKESGARIVSEARQRSSTPTRPYPELSEEIEEADVSIADTENGRHETPTIVGIDQPAPEAVPTFDMIDAIRPGRKKWRRLLLVACILIAGVLALLRITRMLEESKDNDSQDVVALTADQGEEPGSKSQPGSVVNHIPLKFNFERRSGETKEDSLVKRDISISYTPVKVEPPVEVETQPEIEDQPPIKSNGPTFTELKRKAMIAKRHERWTSVISIYRQMLKLKRVNWIRKELGHAWRHRGNMHQACKHYRTYLSRIKDAEKRETQKQLLGSYLTSCP